MTTKTPENKFENMDYETAIGELTRLIGILENSQGTFDELIEVYKDAFEYYTYCCEYLSDASIKIKELNARMASVKRPEEVD